MLYYVLWIIWKILLVLIPFYFLFWNVSAVFSCLNVPHSQLFYQILKTHYISIYWKSTSSLVWKMSEHSHSISLQFKGGVGLWIYPTHFKGIPRLGSWDIIFENVTKQLNDPQQKRIKFYHVYFIKLWMNAKRETIEWTRALPPQWKFVY